MSVGNDGTRYPHGFYTGATVSDLFMQRWRSKAHVGDARPWFQVRIRRGKLRRRYNTWPGEQFGQVWGKPISHQWYADWEAVGDWITLPGVHQIDLDQSFDKNGTCVATIDVDNVAWHELIGHAGRMYHSRERGVLWPWRGWTPPHRPGSGDSRNQFYKMLPNAQIEVRQGYGSDTGIKTFTGLVDSFNSVVRPDRMTITSRDFSGVLTDSFLFGWNKDRMMPDPVTFIPRTHEFLTGPGASDGKSHRWVIIDDVVDIVKCCLRWAGFKEWEVEDSGVNLSTSMVCDKTMTYMDVINQVKEQLGYVFFMAEPTDDDLSIGVPIFRRASVTIPKRSKPITVRDSGLLTDMQPQHDNTDDRHIIRVRGQLNNKLGMGINQGVARTAAQDNFKFLTYVYFPPFTWKMSGVFKALTYYNVGSGGTALGFTSIKDCAVAAVLIGIQIGLARDTATIQTAGNPAFGLDSFAFVTDKGSGISSRLYITNRKSVVAIGGDGSSQQSSPYGTSGSSQNELIWASELGGALVDNPEMEQMVKDYQAVLHTPLDANGRYVREPIKYSGE